MPSPRFKGKKVIDDYWLDKYNNGVFCTLCGNSGVIDTRNTASSRLNWCICPNGQCMRDAYGKDGELPTKIRGKKKRIKT
jgi:hypothetical protein